MNAQVADLAQASGDLNAYMGRSFHLKVLPLAKELFDQGCHFVFYADGELLQTKTTVVKHPDLLARVRDLTGMQPTRQSTRDAQFVQNCYQEALTNANMLSDESEDLVSTDAQEKFAELVSTAIGVNSSDIHIYLRYPLSEVHFRIDGELDPKFRQTISYEACKRMLAATYNWSGAKNSRKTFDVRTLQPSSFQIEVIDPKTQQMVLTAIRLETSPEYTQDSANTGTARPGSAHAVVRVSPNKEIRTLEELGVAPDVVNLMRNFMLRSKGMVLISGPTGSGKTTFLHGSLRFMPSTRMCFTVEDPVELVASYNPMIVQQNLLPGETYDSQLRSLMRQDPDVLMIGEIRDGETAKVAYRAALTGHFVLSTTHTGSALGILKRLLDFGLTTGDLSQPGALSLLVACRLVRNLCPHCKVPVTADYPHAEAINQRLGTLQGVYRANRQGCPECTRGTKGRSSVIEYIVVTNGVRKCIETGDMSGVESMIRANGWRSLQDKGWGMIEQGIIDPEDAEMMITDILIDTAEEFSYTNRAPAAERTTFEVVQ